MSLLPLLFDDSVVVPRTSWSNFFKNDDFFDDPIDVFRHLRSRLAQLEQESLVTRRDDSKFRADIDVQQFRPEELSVKLEGDDAVVVEGKHEDKKDEHGSISRHFVRRYVLANDLDVKQLKAKLSGDGVLSLTAPIKGQGKQVEYKQIPIVSTGKPVKRLEHRRRALDGEGDQKK
ncbi:alpha-crystallin A chain-like [Cylas formicarius]|uniref:alpha-crystallin A chain-like n=1 Tax=Cylas formicarius TaxID=197179 RepID=UPI002958A5B4|nr:alpha-crystallin A chain-like [Cylas formicarius]